MDLGSGRGWDGDSETTFQAVAAAASLGPCDCPFPGLPALHPLGT